MSESPASNEKKGAKRALLFLAVGCLPILIYSFSLRLPPMCDDHFGYAALSGRLYTVGDKYEVDRVVDPEILRVYPQVVPWWASPDMKLIYLRPLTDFVFQLEYRILGEKYGPTVYHLTGIVLNGLTCVFLFLLGRLLFRDDWVAFLGVFIFVGHLAGVTVVPWVAQRADIHSLLLWLAGLYAHIRFRTGGSKKWELLALACFVGSFCAKESGVVCFVSYFLYDLFIWRRESVDGWPGIVRIGLYYTVFAIPLLIFVAYFVLHDYGITGFYSIFGEKGPLLNAIAYMLKNVLLYALGLLFFVPVFHKTNLELFRNPLFLSVALVLLALACLLFYPGVRKRLLKDRVHAFLLSWMLTAQLPSLHILTQSKYLFMSLAPFGLFMSRYLFQVKRTNGFGKRTKALFYVLVIFYAVFPMATIWGLEITTDALYKSHGYQARVVKETKALIGESRSPVNAFFLNLPNPILTFALQYAFDFYGEKGEVLAFPLTITREVPEVTVLDDHSLVITSRSNPFLEGEGERVYMTDSLSREGAVRANKFLKATIQKVEDGHIYAIRFDFVTPMDDESMRFFYMKDHHVYPAPLVSDKRGQLRFELPSYTDDP